jgi:Asp-tRNA(Asn)/Glu-tRNA(Gln) amidotransferase A subunit family amidase
VAKPLDGLAVAIKDESYIANQVTTNGSLLLQHNRVTTTDPVPQRLLDQGAYIHARTTTPEFSTAGVTWSRLWGVTRNPWNTAITCGGSSGGSAVAVATGMASFANGTDAGGSIRIPAALCGLYGYKAPHGRVPEIAPYGLEPYCHHGVLTRTLDDLLYLYPLIKGQHFSDLHSFVPDVNPHLISDKTLNKIRVAVSADLGFYHVEPDIVVALHNTVNELRNIGVEVEWVKIGWDERVIETAKVHQWAMLGQMLRQKYSSTADRALMTSYAQNYLMGADNLRVSDIVAANLYAAKMWESLAEVFQQYDVLLCPTMASNAIAADFDYSRDRAFINGKEVDANKGWFMTYAFNTLNSCPVLAMPNGRSQNGVPTSVQIVGRPYEEAYLFEVARHLSRTLAADFFHTLFPSLPNASN